MEQCIIQSLEFNVIKCLNIKTGRKFMIKNIFNRLDRIDIKRFIFTFPFIATLHELEEWNILNWHIQHNTNVPTEVTDFHLRFAFIIISILIFIWTIVSLLPKDKKITAYIFSPLILISLINSFEHLFWTVSFGAYAPGLIFGFVFEVPLIIYIIYRMLKEKLINRWFAGIVGIIVLAGIVKVILHGNELDPLIADIMRLSKRITDVILIYPDL
jgi:hypothetical protein